MKQVMLLTLLAVALPTAALANSIEFSTGSSATGTITSNLHSPINLSVSGNGITIALTNLVMSPTNCNPSGITCTFNSGTLTVSEGGNVVFTSSLDDGLLTKVGSNDLTFSASLVPGTCSPTQCLSGTVTLSHLMKSGASITSGTGTVRGTTSTVVPEPGTLGLLGTGVIGLAGMMRRKLTLST